MPTSCRLSAVASRVRRHAAGVAGRRPGALRMGAGPRPPDTRRVGCVRPRAAAPAAGARCREASGDRSAHARDGARARRGAAGQADLEGLGREISVWLAAAVSDQIPALGEIGLSTLVMVDEPGLMAAHRVGAAPAVWDALRAVAPAWGLHVCGEVPWRLLDAAEPDVISYDLVQSGCEPTAQTVIRRLMRRRSRIMWGAIDPQVVDAPHRVGDRVRAAVRAVAGRQWTTQDVLSASLLSGPAANGGVSVARRTPGRPSIQSVAGLLRSSEMAPGRSRYPSRPPPALRLEPIGGLRGENRARPDRECTIAAESVKVASATKGTRSSPGLTRSGRGDERALVHWVRQTPGKEPARSILSPKPAGSIRHHGFATRADASTDASVPSPPRSNT